MEIQPRMLTKKILFAATYPNPKTGVSPSYIGPLEQKYIILHPSYNFETDEGRQVQAWLGPDLPSYPENPWHQIQSRDYWALEKSRLMIYDLDVDPGEHFFAAALLYNIPALGVSSNLRGVPPYFSQNVLAIVRPENLVGAVRLILRPDVGRLLRNRQGTHD